MMTAVVFVFGFSAVLGDYVCAEANLLFLGARQRAVTALKVSTLIAVGLGAVLKLTFVWALADLGMALMAIVNLVAICLLGNWAFAALKDFHRQLKAGDDPVFVADEAGLPDALGGDVWKPPARAPVGVASSTPPSVTAVG
jgi:AGCS family alanine or glycine:cation symporter